MIKDKTCVKMQILMILTYTLCQAFLECEFWALLNYMYISAFVFIINQKKELPGVSGPELKLCKSFTYNHLPLNFSWGILMHIACYLILVKLLNYFAVLTMCTPSLVLACAKSHFQ